MPRVVPSQVVNFIDHVWEFAATQSAGQTLGVRHRTQLAGLLDLIVLIPEELIQMGTVRFTEYVSAVANIRETLKSWGINLQPQTGVPSMPEFGDLSPVALIRRALNDCPDEAPSPDTDDLQFISDNDLRLTLRTDISSANRDLSEGQWKSATVMAGSAIEALLFWALVQLQPSAVDSAANSLVSDGMLRDPGADLQRWDLNAFIAVASKLQVISANTAKQTMLAKDFRNLIHPGRAQRLGEVCDRGTALCALAAVELVVRDLTCADLLEDSRTSPTQYK